MLTNKIDVYYVLWMQYFHSSLERATRNATPRMKYPSQKLYILFNSLVKFKPDYFPVKKKKTEKTPYICQRFTREQGYWHESVSRTMKNRTYLFEVRRFYKIQFITKIKSEYTCEY